MAATPHTVTRRRRSEAARLAGVLLCAALLVVLGRAPVGAQTACTVPDRIRDRVPTPPPPSEVYETRWVTGAEGLSIDLGSGHLVYSDRNPYTPRPPGENDWLRRIELPLSPEPAAPATAWIVRGWVVRPDGDPVELLRSRQIETGYEETSLVVLEEQGDWLLVRFGLGEGRGWVPRCALEAGPELVDYATWTDWLAQREVLFFRSGSPEGLFASPDDGRELDPISGDYHLEPLEVRGSWMRVRVREPSDYCDFDVESRVREGWVRWRDESVGPRLWYYTRGC